MTLEDIANYCEFKDCQISLGSPETGFVRLDGNGLQKANNYRRFLSLNELAAAPSPKKVLEAAQVFKVRRGEEESSLSREEFEAELRKFAALVGA